MDRRNAFQVEDFENPLRLHEDMKNRHHHHRAWIAALKAGLWVVLGVFYFGHGIQSANASLIFTEVSTSSAQILDAIEHASPISADVASTESAGTGFGAKPLASSAELSEQFIGFLFGNLQPANLSFRSCQPESSSSAPTSPSVPSASSAILTPNSELANLVLLSFWRPGLFLNVPAPPTSELLRPPQFSQAI